VLQTDIGYVLQTVRSEETADATDISYVLQSIGVAEHRHDSFSFT
jgi:hypothetical protein